MAENRLMLCAGITRRDGWKTLDCKSGHDFIATIPPLPDAVKQTNWDEIEWVHGITSLYPWDGFAVLKEIRGVLSENGKLVLEQPDFRKAKDRVEWLFGDWTLQEPLIMNKWSYSPESLTAQLKRAGYSRIEILPAQHHVPSRDFRVEVYR
jgi:hypothetical protein